MATALKLRSDINKLKKALQTKGISDSVKSKLKNQLERAESELDTIKKTGKAPKKSSVKSTKTALTALQKLVNRKKYSVYKGAGVDLEKDAGQGALATGRRISKGLKANQNGDKGSNKGNVYYEYRPNHLDVKQPKKKQTYPKLERGGMMADGGKTVGFTIYYEPQKNLGGKSVQSDEEIRGNYRDMDKVLDKRIGDNYLGSNFYIGDGYGKIILKDESSVKEVKQILDMFDFEDKTSSYKKEKGGYMADGGKLESGVYRIGKPSKVSQNLYEQKIVEIFDNGDIATASDYGRKMSDFSGNSYPIISQEQLEAQYKMAKGGGIDEIDMEKVESAAKFYTDESRWSVKPTISKFEEEIKNYKELKRKLDNKETTPSKIIGSGYKPQLARPLAYKWLKEKSLIAERAIEILKEKEKMASGGYMAKGGMIEHGLKVGDVIKGTIGDVMTGYSGKNIVVENDGKTFVVNLDEGERWSEDNFRRNSTESISSRIGRRYMADGGYMASGGKVKVGDTLTASTGVKVKVVEYDPMFGGRVKIERMDEYATGKPSQWMPLSKFKMADGGIMADGAIISKTHKLG